MSSPRENVFVYGTLRSGGSNHFRMEGADFLGAGTVRGRLYRIDWYPGLVLDPEAAPVIGEVYAVDSAQLRALDEFEGVSAGEIEGSEYRRVPTGFESKAGLTLTVWVWEWLGPVDGDRHISNGDWLG